MDFLMSLGRRRAISALVALVVAFGAGFLMQVILADRTPIAAVDRIPDAAPILRDAEAPARLPTPPAATLVPLQRPPVMPDRVDTPTTQPPDVHDDARMSPFGFDCTPALTLKARDAAMIEARLFAPCDPRERVALRHGALEIDLTTDAFGRAATMLPALSEVATVTALLPRQAVEAGLYISDAEAFSRVVIVWEGARVFRMNAYEFGATEGQAGHIRAGFGKTASRAMRGTGGFLVTIGDGSGRSAEVYSFPTGYSPLHGVVKLVVEADVTDETCGQQAKATALQSRPLGGMTATDVRVTLPGCDRVGDVMELKNLLQDMRLAGR